MNLITPDSGLVVWMTIIFAIVFFILAKFGFPVITSMVKKRNDKIHDSLAAARLAEEKLATLAQQQQELLEKARVEQAALLKDAAAARDNPECKAGDCRREGGRPQGCAPPGGGDIPGCRRKGNQKDSPGHRRTGTASRPSRRRGDKDQTGKLKQG